MLALTLLPAKKPVAFLCTTQLVMWTSSCVEPEDGLTLIPFPALLMIVVLLISRRPPPMRLSAIPWPGFPFCPSIRQLTMKTAGVEVVADTGHPGAGRLSLSKRGEREHEDSDCQYLDSEPKLIHLESPYFPFRSLEWPPARTDASPHCCADGLKP